MDGALDILQVNFGDVRCLALSGHLGSQGARKVDGELRRLESDGPPMFILDLSDLHCIDVAGLHVIVGADRRARQAGRVFALVRGPERVHRVFCLAGLHERLEFMSLCDLEGAVPAEASAAAPEQAAAGNGAPARAQQGLLLPEVARLLGISPRTIKRWVREGKMPGARTLTGQEIFPESFVRDLAHRFGGCDAGERA